MKCLSLKLFLCCLLVACSVAAEESPPRNVFDIWEYQVEGNSLLDNAEIESTLYPFLGAGRDLQATKGERR